MDTAGKCNVWLCSIISICRKYLFAIIPILLAAILFPTISHLFNTCTDRRYSFPESIWDRHEQGPIHRLNPEHFRASRQLPMLSSNSTNTYGVFPKSFWFVKVPKVGGSTLAGIFRQIASHYGVNMINPFPGEFQLNVSRITEVLSVFATLDYAYFGIANHIPYAAWKHHSSGIDFLRFTAVRNPFDRSLSDYYFFCTRMHNIQECGDDWDGMLDHLLSTGTNSMCNYALGGNFTTHAAAEYDFIFVTDRMDESIVAFKLLYGLRWIDIAYLPSKVLNDKYEEFSEMDDMKKEIISDILLTKVRGDLAFYSYASQRLDRTIKYLDSLYEQNTFSKHLSHFNIMLKKVGRRCGKEKNESRWHDNGKNFRCIENLVSDEFC